MFKRLFGKGLTGDRLAAAAIEDYRRSHDEGDVVRRLEKAIAMGLRELPLDEAYTYLGAAYADLGRHAEAETSYEAALRHNPSNSTALSNLGLACENRADFPRARQLYERAIQAKPHNGYAHNNLGVLLIKQGLYAEARVALQRATELDPTLAVAHANLARCCAHVGDLAAAQEALLQASRRGYPGSESLRAELTELVAAQPPVYLDEDALLRLAGSLLDHDAAFTQLLKRALRAPRELYGELTAGGRAFFFTDHQVTHALPWLLLCDEVVRRGLAVRGANRPLEQWISLLIGAVRKRDLPAPELPAGELGRELRARSEDPGDDGAALDQLIYELTDARELVILRLWETAKQAVICPLSVTAWNAVAYPFLEGEPGPGLVENLFRDPPGASARVLN